MIWCYLFLLLMSCDSLKKFVFVSVIRVHHARILSLGASFYESFGIGSLLCNMLISRYSPKDL